MSLINTIKFITSHPLNRQNKLSSIIRFAKWQVGSRLVPGAISYDWINGAKFLVKTGETGLTGNVYTGLHEFTDMGFLLHFLRSEDLFVDVGANVGSYTILACAVIGANGVAFEPVPSTYNRLVENMRLNRLDEKVKCENKGVGDDEGIVAFTSDFDTTNHALASGESGENVLHIQVVTLDLVLKDRCPSLIKIDVEGYEKAVLEGARETLTKKSLHAVIMELNGSGSRYGYDESLILEFMFEFGFKAYSYSPFDRKLTNLEGKNLELGNTLFIRDRPYVEKRLRTAPKIAVHGRQF